MTELLRRMNGEIFAYWEQGWEGRIEFAFQPDESSEPIFLKNGYRLTIYEGEGKVLWSGTIHFVARRFWDHHRLTANIWSDVKQRGGSYSQWMDWFWRQPPLKARLEAE